MADKQQRSSELISIGIGSAINVVSSISLIFMNKIIYNDLSFPNMTLTWVHFVVTFVCIFACSKLRVFNVKAVSIREMLPLSLTFCGFVVLTNMSLQYNTVGTYQIFKVLTTPCIMAISGIFYGKKYSPSIVLTVVGLVFKGLTNILTCFLVQKSFRLCVALQSTRCTTSNSTGMERS
jgi:solute carrier family 35 protein E3